MHLEKLGFAVGAGVLAIFLYAESLPAFAQWIGDGFQGTVLRWLWRLAGLVLGLVVGACLALLFNRWAPHE